jgi:two-component system sensor histidine kinase HydH
MVLFTQEGLMRKQFTKLDKEEILILGGAGFLLLVVAVLSTLLVSSTNARENVLLQYEAEQALTDFMFQLQEDDVDVQKMFSDNDSVRGLGIYTHAGVLIVGIGDIPDRLNMGDYELKEGKLAEYNSSTRTIEYIRRAKIALTATNFAQTPLQDAVKKVTIPFAELLYISFDGTAYRSRKIMGWALDIFLILLMTGAFILISRIYTRNRQYREKLAQQESLVSMGEAARTLAHEIKNPLSSISLQAAVLKKTIPPDHEEDVELIEHEVQRLNTLANRVGDFLKNPLGEPQPINLYEFLSHIAGRFSPDIPVSCEDELKETKVHMDPDRARSVFENLLNNAAESSEDDAEVTVEITSAKDSLVVRILDRGDGLPPGGEKQLFDPFFTTKARGSGIGLAITRRFVSAAGGSMRIYAREKKGTIAELTFPGSMTT